MKRICAALLAVVAISGWSSSSSHAAPPTVTPSPGYDARLQEQRAASSTTFYAPAAPVTKSAIRHRTKRTHTH